MPAPRKQGLIQALLKNYGMVVNTPLIGPYFLGRWPLTPVKIQWFCFPQKLGHLLNLLSNYYWKVIKQPARKQKKKTTTNKNRQDHENSKKQPTNDKQFFDIQIPPEKVF